MRFGLMFVAVVAGTVFAGMVPAQPRTGKPAATEMRAADKASPRLMTGKATQVDASARSFTIVVKGKEQRFAAANGVALPKVGDVVDVTFTGAPGGPMEAINLNSSKSNAY